MKVVIFTLVYFALNTPSPWHSKNLRRGSAFDSVIPMTSFVTLVVFVSSAPGPPANLSHTVIAPSESHYPQVNLTWSRPQQENGIIRGYNLLYSHNEDQESVHTEIFGPDTYSYSVDVLGGAIYQFYVRAVTIKPGTNTSITVDTPEYGKRVFFVYVFVF